MFIIYHLPQLRQSVLPVANTSSVCSRTVPPAAPTTSNANTERRTLCPANLDWLTMTGSRSATGLMSSSTWDATLQVLEIFVSRTSAYNINTVISPRRIYPPLPPYIANRGGNQSHPVQLHIIILIFP